MASPLLGVISRIVAAIDWEQACICPAEAVLGWWLATRRQTMEVQGVRADPELPGFDSREQVIRRCEDLLGRKLHDLNRYEMFSMVRMACCILRTQVLLRNLGQTHHGFLRADSAVVGDGMHARMIMPITWWRSRW